MKSRFALPHALLLFSPLLAPAAGASESAAVAGRVVAAGAPVAGAQVRALGTTRQAASDADGAFVLDGLPPGRVVVEAQSARHGRAVAALEVATGETARVELALSREIHGGELTVTASPTARAGDELARPLSVLEGTELLAALEPTLGETLAKQPGVSSTYFGPGASRPVIRGQGGDRVRVLDNGLGTGDVSTTSPDHALALDPLAAERVEIVRGPATLLYGSGAVGGVVNVLDDAIPDYLPEERLTGSLTLRVGTAAEERAGSAELAGSLGRFAWHADLSRRESDDVEIPGYAESAALRAEEAAEGEGEEQEQAFGVLPNSAVETESGRFGLSWVGERGFLGVSYARFDTLYGVPGHAHEHAAGEEHGGEEHEGEEHEGEEEEAPVRIDLAQERLDVRGEWGLSRGLLRGLELRFGSVDYEHVELEGDEVGTRFTTESREARLEARHRDFGTLTGVWGAQWSEREFVALGEEAFVPANDASTRALFAFEEVVSGALTWQFGARYEEIDFDVADPALPDRSFGGLSGSAGVVWKVREPLGLMASIARSVTAPNAEALYSNGPHVATRVFEVGDPTLGEETSLNAEVGVRGEAGRFRGELTLFRNDVDDFVYEAFTGDEEDGLPVVAFRQDDARFTGFEAQGHVELYHAGESHLELDLSLDSVRAELRRSGEPLPRIPPLRYGAGLTWRSDRWSASADVRRVEEQERVAPFETATDGYTMVGATLGWRFFVGDTVHDLLLSGVNLGDEEARVHASYLKELAPLPGRDVRLTYRVSF
jgi:iron complex outermembrane receptor protein